MVNRQQDYVANEMFGIRLGRFDHAALLNECLRADASANQPVSAHAKCAPLMKSSIKTTEAIKIFHRAT